VSFVRFSDIPLFQIFWRFTEKKMKIGGIFFLLLKKNLIFGWKKYWWVFSKSAKIYSFNVF